MFLNFLNNIPVLYAMLLLYLMLGMASAVVGWYSQPASQLRKQVNAWWLIFPILTVSLVLYPVGLLLLTVAITLLTQRELALHHIGPGWKLHVPCGLIVVLQTGLTLNDIAGGSALLFGLVLLQGLCFSLRQQVNPLLLLLFLLVCWGLSFIQRILDLPLLPQEMQSWIFYLFALTALNDIAQFVSGKSLGTHKIAARISPNKTWQGLGGGVLISLLTSVVLGLFLELASLDRLLMLGLLLSIAGFLGDLLFSAAKRYLKIKDFSQLIPGHGGILDRVDSLVLTAPVLYFWLTLTL